MPFKDFQPSVLSSADVNTYLMKQSVMTFANASARSSALTAPVEGMVTYLEDTNKTYQYDGTNWLEIVKLNSAGQLLNPNGVAFYVTREGGGITSNTRIAFDTIKLNRGNGFGFANTTNARFTASFAGVFYFFWTGIGNNTNDVYRYRLYLNGAQYQDEHFRADTNATGTEFATNGARGILLQLQANDYVQIHFISDLGNAAYGTGNYVSFGGWLIG